MAQLDSHPERAGGLPLPSRPVTLLVGDFGSGKTEVAVNLSLQWAAALAPRRLTIADLDLVNPYFRCREAREPMEKAGIRVVMPRDGHEHADLPILLPEIKGLLENPGDPALLDVGGDSVGSRVLAALSSWVPAGGYDLWFVANGNRPFNDSVEGCLSAVRRIEQASRLHVTGVVSNTHLMQDTTPEMVVEGCRLAEHVASALAVPVALVAVMETVERELSAGEIAHPVLKMRRLRVPPWLRRGRTAVGPELFRLGPA
jgi:hypothetical protein